MSDALQEEPTKEDEDLAKMNKEIDRWVAKTRIWFFCKYHSDAGKEESLKGFG